ncbi:hypothetical protein Aperf_G00000055041 [Anoplocephala perfoliata]
MIRSARQHHQNHYQNRNHHSQSLIVSSSHYPSSSSRRTEHSLSTPNLDLTTLTSDLAAATSADTVMVDGCPCCGLPDLSAVTAKALETRENTGNSAIADSLSALIVISRCSYCSLSYN